MEKKAIFNHFKYALLFLGLVPICAFAQEAVTAKGSLNIVKEVKPPILSVVDGSLQFIDKTGNNAIDANEACSLVFDVQNTGMGDATGCKVVVALSGSTSGLQVSNQNLSTIPVGGKIHVELPIKANMQTVTGEVKLSVRVTEPLGFDIPPFDVAVHTKAFDSPFIKVADYAVNGAAVLQKNQPFDLQVAVQNVKSGKAEMVKVDMVIPQGVYLLSGNDNLSFADLEGGKAQTITYKLIVPTNYQQDKVPVQIKLSERYGKYAENRTIELPLNQQMAQHSISIDERAAEKNDFQLTQVSLGSDVDKNIPQTKSVNNDTYVLIFANESYDNVASVPFALRDGEVFRQYCEQTLGITTKNHLKIYKNATYGKMLDGIEWLKQALTINPNARAIVYYTGHGIPDEEGKSAYLLPTDGNAVNLRPVYSVNELYEGLGASERPVTVFLDACFSGAKREGGPDLLVSAKGVAYKTPIGVPRGKMVVFSAASGDETAGFYKQQQHGMFTYWLLKAMQESNGDITYDQLSASLKQHVRQSSFDENGKVQTPTVMTGPSAMDWKSWKLK